MLVDGTPSKCLIAILLSISNTIIAGFGTSVSLMGIPESEMNAKLSSILTTMSFKKAVLGEAIDSLKR